MWLFVSVIFLSQHVSSHHQPIRRGCPYYTHLEQHGLLGWDWLGWVWQEFWKKYEWAEEWIPHIPTTKVWRTVTEHLLFNKMWTRRHASGVIYYTHHCMFKCITPCMHLWICCNSLVISCTSSCLCNKNYVCQIHGPLVSVLDPKPTPVRIAQYAGGNIRTGWGLGIRLMLYTLYCKFKTK